MKNKLNIFIKVLIFTNSVLIPFICNSQINYTDWFTDNSMRIDYYHSGTSTTEYVMLKEIRKEEFWGGTKTNLIDPYNFGQYRVHIFDSATNTLLFTYGFCSLFEEWQFTNEATTNIERGFPESLIFPFPLKTIKIELKSRVFVDNSFKTIMELFVDPNANYINSEKTVTSDFKQILKSAPSDKALDLVFISEGYTKEEISSFYADVKNAKEFLSKTPPFNKLMDKINIWAVAAISNQSGTDLPHNGVWKSTALNSNFNTFNSKRYLTSSDFHAIKNYAGIVPCDQVCIFVNTETYGGGGIYNFWNITSAKNEYYLEIFAHELGHSLGALGDEYYTDQVSTEDIYNKNTEPYQSNLTTLINFDSKWKDMLDTDTNIPTEIDSKNTSKIGVYEGGGYQAKGIYRPYINCRMKALGYDFCPVCQRTLERVIKYHSE